MQEELLPYLSVFIKILKGPIDYTERTTWEKLIKYQSELSAFLPKMGLRLVVDGEDGFAFLEQTTQEDEENSASWVIRRSLTYEESVMLILLREMMLEFEIGESGNRELIKKRREIKEYAELFFKENASRVKFLKQLDQLIEKVADFGFLEKVDDNEVKDEQRYRIKKIIKARVDSEQLDQFAGKLADHSLMKRIPNS